MFLRVPESWPQPIVAAVAMVLLAALDLGGAFAAKEAVERRSPVAAGIGVLLFAVLFWVFASSLQVAELAPVTFGWVVILQVGVVLLDRYRYGVTLPTGKWIAVAILLLAQAYLLLGPEGRPERAPSRASRQAASQAPAQNLDLRPAVLTLAEIRLPDGGTQAAGGTAPTGRARLHPPLDGPAHPSGTRPTE